MAERKRESSEARTSKAVTVLEEQMLFYQDKAKGLIIDILNALENEPIKNPAAIAMMYKSFEAASDKARDCAAKLAPYQTPRLESIETKSEVEHKFVVRLPQVISNANEWLQKVEQDKSMKLIEAESDAEPA